MPSRTCLASLPLILLVTVLAAIPRVAGHRCGIPYHSEPDQYLVEQVRGLETRGLTSRFDAGWKYPLLLAFLTAAMPSAFEPDTPSSAPISARAETALDPTPRLMREAGVTHAQTRLAVALLSALIGPAVFLLARGFLTPHWSAVAGGLAAGSLLHVVFSGQARPHAPASVFAVLAIAAAVHAARRPATSTLLLLGAATSLACTALHTGALTLIPMGLAMAVGLRRVGRRLLPGCLVAGALVASGVYWAYAPGERATKLAQMRVGSSGAVFVSGHELPTRSFDFTGTHAVADWLVSYDPLLVVLAVFGLALGVRRLRALPHEVRNEVRLSSLVVASYALPALLLYSAYARTASRLLLALTAVLAVPAAAALASSTRRLSPRARAVVVVAVVCAATGPGLWLSWLRTRPTVHVAAAEWLREQRLPNGERPRTYALNLPSLPLLRDDLEHVAAVQWLTTEWERFQVTLASRDGGHAAHTFGVPLLTPTAADTRAVATAEDLDAAVREVLDRVAPDIVLLDVAVPLNDPLPTQRRMAAIRRVVAPPRYELMAAFDATPDTTPEYQVGYQCDLPLVLRARSLGGRIEAWRRATHE